MRGRTTDMVKRLKFIVYIFLIFMGFFSKSNADRLNLESLVFTDINGDKFDLNNIDSKIILIVNTASFCGFTKQYAHLQALRNKYSEDDLLIIAIPSDDFGNQEFSSNKEIADFCEVNFGITFPIMSKEKIIGANKHDFYKIIEDSFGIKFLPKWNFHKYLIKNDGSLISSFSSHISPLAPKFIEKIESNL